MKRLRPAVLVVLILAANSVQAQTDAPRYRSSDATVYTDIVGELESSDDWIVQPDNEPEVFSQASIAQTSAPPLAPRLAPAAQNMEVFASSPQRLHDWRRSEAGQLWDTPDGPEGETWYDGRLRLQFGIDYLYFSRGAAADDFFAFNDLGETFSLGDIDPGNDTTLRYRFLIVDDGGTGYEITGYDFEDFNGSLTLEGEGITPVFFGGTPAEPAESYEATYTSDLTNIEANVWNRRSERLKIGFGARYIKLEEQFDIEFIEDPNSTSGGGTTTGMTDGGFFSNTANRIFGGQVMARLYRPVVNRVYLEGGVDAGFGTNRITADSDTANVDSNTEDDTGTGFFGFSGGVTYRVLDGLSLRAGYEGLLLTDVALSPDQSTAIDSVNGTGEIQTGSLYFSGAYFGGTIRF